MAVLTNLTNGPTLLRLNPCFAILVGLSNLTGRVSAVALLSLFHLSGDKVWFGLTLTIVCLSTCLDILISLHDHPAGVGCLWCVLSILQLKPWADTFTFFSSPVLRQKYTLENHDTLRDNRVKLFLSTTVHSLPLSFLICYIMMLDLHDRINENYLLLALIFSVMSFALGTTLFVAGDDPAPFASLIVFIHVLSQFFFRVLALALICVRFEKWGALAVAVSWLLVYLFGPQGSGPSWYRLLTCSLKHEENHCVPCLKVFLTPLSFFVLLRLAHAPIKTIQSSSGSITNIPDDEINTDPVLVYHCFPETAFIWFRLLENAVMVICFFAVQMQDDTREYEGWMHSPGLVLGAAGASVLLTGLTWIWVSKPHPV